MPTVVINEELVKKFITHKGAIDFCDRIFREGKDKARMATASEARAFWLAPPENFKV